MGGVSIRPLIRDYFQQNPNREITRQEICRELKLQDRQVTVAVNNLRNKDGMNLEVVTRGHVWKYVPAPDVRAVRHFEEIGQGKDGALIIRDQDGDIYRAERV